MHETTFHTDHDLIALVAKDDTAAFRVLYDRYRDKLYFFILNLSHSRETAEDTLQDVFLKIWVNRNQLPEIDNFNAYLFRMASNQVTDIFRRATLETSIVRKLETSANENPEQPVTPEEIFLSKQVEQKVMEAVSGLTEQQKMVYRLSREEGLKRKEIAEQLSISEETVKKHMNAALRAIREHVQRFYPGGIVVAAILFGLP